VYYICSYFGWNVLAIFDPIDFKEIILNL